MLVETNGKQFVYIRNGERECNCSTEVAISHTIEELLLMFLPLPASHVIDDDMPLPEIYL